MRNNVSNQSPFIYNAVTNKINMHAKKYSSVFDSVIFFLSLLIFHLMFLFASMVSIYFSFIAVQKNKSLSLLHLSSLVFRVLRKLHKIMDESLFSETTSSLSESMSQQSQSSFSSSSSSSSSSSYFSTSSQDLGKKKRLKEGKVKSFSESTYSSPRSIDITDDSDEQSLSSPSSERSRKKRTVRSDTNSTMSDSSSTNSSIGSSSAGSGEPVSADDKSLSNSGSQRSDSLSDGGSETFSDSSSYDSWFDSDASIPSDNNSEGEKKKRKPRKKKSSLSKGEKKKTVAGGVRRKTGDEKKRKLISEKKKTLKQTSSVQSGSEKKETPPEISKPEPKGVISSSKANEMMDSRKIEHEREERVVDEIVERERGMNEPSISTLQSAIENGSAKASTSQGGEEEIEGKLINEILAENRSGLYRLGRGAGKSWKYIERPMRYDESDPYLLPPDPPSHQEGESSNSDNEIASGEEEESPEIEQINEEPEDQALESDDNESTNDKIGNDDKQDEEEYYDDEDDHPMSSRQSSVTPNETLNAPSHKQSTRKKELWEPTISTDIMSRNKKNSMENSDEASVPNTSNPVEKSLDNLSLEELLENRHTALKTSAASTISPKSGSQKRKNYTPSKTVAGGKKRKTDASVPLSKPVQGTKLMPRDKRISEALKALKPIIQPSEQNQPTPETTQIKKGGGRKRRAAGAANKMKENSITILLSSINRDMQDLKKLIHN